MDLIIMITLGLFKICPWSDLSAQGLFKESFSVFYHISY